MKLKTATSLIIIAGALYLYGFPTLRFMVGLYAGSRFNAAMDAGDAKRVEYYLRLGLWCENSSHWDTNINQYVSDYK